MAPTLRDATEADAPAMARVHVASWRSTYAGLLPAEFLASLDEAKRASNWRTWIRENDGTRRYRVVEEDGRIVGFAAFGPAREPLFEERGEVYAIYLLAEVQGRGLGRRLFADALDSLRANDLSPVMLWVLEGNPACGFYEKMGLKRSAAKDVVLGGAQVRELAYVG